MGSRYDVTPEERDAFGNNWCGPDTFIDSGVHLVAYYPAPARAGTRKKQRRCVWVYCEARPDRIYTIRVSGYSQLSGCWNKPFMLQTGNNSAKLASEVARAISELALQIYVEPGD